MSASSSTSRVLSATVTGLLVLCAVTATGMMVRRELLASRAPVRVAPSEPQADWKEYAEFGNRIGSPTARVALVEFSDFECPACAEMERRLRITRQRFGDRFAMVYRHFPLSSHKHAEDAAGASECAAAQQRFEAMHAALFDHADSIGRVKWEWFAELARVPNVESFRRCMATPATDSVVWRDRDAGKRVGARGTPTILAGGRRFSGTIPQAVLDSIVEAALSGDRR